MYGERCGLHVGGGGGGGNLKIERGEVAGTHTCIYSVL